jgi:hypothetical protein
MTDTCPGFAVRFDQFSTFTGSLPFAVRYIGLDPRRSAPFLTVESHAIDPYLGLWHVARRAREMVAAKGGTDAPDRPGHD